MHATRFVGLHYPRPALVDARAAAPRRYYAGMVSDLLRCSAPASRRPRALRAAVARHGLLRLPVSALLAVSPGRDRPEMAGIRDELQDNWPALAAGSPRLPERAPELSLLCVRRSLGWLVFAFGSAEHPLLLCKVPDEDDARADQEADVLRQVAAAGVAPRYLGRAGRARVQEGLPGSPLRLAPLTVDDAARAGWDDRLEEVAQGLLRLSAITRAAGAPADFLSPQAEALLPEETAAGVRAALHRLVDADVSVLCHGDTSAQNVLVADGSVSGLVDWEFARRGLPAADVLNLAHSMFEQRLGLRRWREAEVVAAFADAWARAPLFAEARRAATAAARAAGLDEDLAGDLAVAVYARRLQRRVDRPGSYLVTSAMAASMLAAVCAR